MKFLYVVLVVAAVIVLRVWVFRSRRRRKDRLGQGADAADDAGAGPIASPGSGQGAPEAASRAGMP